MTSADDLINYYKNRRQEWKDDDKPKEIKTPYVNETTGEEIIITEDGSILPNKHARWDDEL